MNNTNEPQLLAERVDMRTQQLLAEKIGLLVIGAARLQAEAEAWAEKARAAEKAASE